MAKMATKAAILALP